MRRGITIQTFLVDGNPKGIKIAEISNRTIQAYLIPREKLGEAKKMDSLNRVGYYFLFGTDNKTENDMVYIGEAENVLERLIQHNQKKEFWEQAILIVSDNNYNQLTKADVKFLEYFGYNRAIEVGRYEVENKQVPTQPYIHEWRQSDLIDIFETSELLLGTLGFTVFEDIIEPPDIYNGPDKKEKHLFYLKGKSRDDTLVGDSWDASGIYTEEGFVVLKGSRFSNYPSPSYLKKPITNQKFNTLIQQDKLKKEGKYFVATTNIVFNSPSTAAMQVRRTSSNGWTEWKDTNNQSLSDIYR